jgi:hypothetical protein
MARELLQRGRRILARKPGHERLRGPAAFIRLDRQERAVLVCRVAVGKVIGDLEQEAQGPTVPCKRFHRGLRSAVEERPGPAAGRHEVRGLRFCDVEVLLEGR